MATPGRKTQLQVIHEFSASFSPTGPYTQAQLAAGVLVGMLPAGAIALICNTITNPAWNGSVSVALNVGNQPTGIALIAAQDIRTASIRADVPVGVNGAGPYGADTPVYASFVFGGTLGTIGLTTVVVQFLPGVG